MLPSMFDVEAFILVGGQSSRMGSDKSQLVFGRHTGLRQIAQVLRTLTARVRVVGARDNGDFDDLPNIPDTHERWGALGGIHAALAAGGTEWAIIVACDLPLISPELIERLSHIAGGREAESFDAVVPMQPDGRPQPLCAFYRRITCAAAATNLIREGEHKPRALLAHVRTRWVSFKELSDLPGAENFFLNVNTPDDYRRANEIVDA